jgi:PAS domain S-box-containing protein
MRTKAKAALNFLMTAALFLLFLLFLPAALDFLQAGVSGYAGPSCAACFPIPHPAQISLFLILTYALFNHFSSKLKSSEEKAYELLAASEDRFRLMIENTPVGVCIIDEYGMFEYVNTAFTELYEYEQDELIGNHITVIILENLYEIAMRNYNDFINGSIPLSREWSASTKSGKKLTVLVNSARITDLAGKRKSILFIVDITDRQKMEQELIKSREILKTARDAAESLNHQKSRFLASVSHDIRTPLNSIIGFSDLLDRSLLSAEQKEMVHCLKNSGGDLLALINDILDLSKIEAGKFEIVNEPFDIRRTFSNAVNSIAPLAEKKGVKISVATDGQINLRVSSDAHRYKQVVNNLLSNAVKFTPNGEIRAELLVTGQCEAYYTIVTSVTDSGIGIDPEMQKKLFTPFEQCGRTTSRKYGGTGLGLAISSQIVRLLGGDAIRVESQPGRGSRFYFSLNLKKAGPETNAAEREERKYGEKSTERIKSLSNVTKLTILVADDCEINIKLISTILTGQGHAVVCARDGLEALDVAGRMSVDLILMDVNMPKLDGFSATAELRRRGIKAPVIAVTAAAMQEDINKCKMNGMDDVLIKPLIYDSFISKINEYAVKLKA